MKIKDVEELTQLARTNIRFYEMEGFIHPTRSNNGYRDYSNEDVNVLLKIKLLRHLGLSLDEIKLIHHKSTDLIDILKKHVLKLSSTLDDTKLSLEICNQIIEDNISYDELNNYNHISINNINENKYYFMNSFIWRRFFAKIFDLGFYYFLFLFIYALDSTVYLISFDRYPRPLADIIVTICAMFLVEPVLLSCFHTTLGKKICGLKLEVSDNSSYFDMVKRTLLVFIHGLGCFIPVINIYCLYRSYIICENEYPLSWEFNNKTILNKKSYHSISYTFLSLLLIYSIIVCNHQISFPILKNGFIRDNLGTLEFGGNFNNYLRYKPSLLGKDAMLWDEDNIGIILDEYDNPINDRRFPEIHFVTNENHEITELSISQEWHESRPHHYIEIMTYCIRSSVKAKESIFIPFSRAEQIIDYIEKHPFESFEFIEKDYTIKCEVEYGGGYHLNCFDLDTCTLSIVTYADNYVEPNPYYNFNFTIKFTK